MIGWFSLSPRQQTIRFSMYAYYLVTCGVKPWHYLRLGGLVYACSVLRLLRQTN